MKAAKWIYLLLAGSFLLPVSAFSQVGSLQGLVKDSKTGGPIPHAFVTVHDTLHHSLLVGAQCDSNGVYQFAGLPAGTYRVQCQVAANRIATLPQVAILPGDTQYAELWVPKNSAKSKRDPVLVEFALPFTRVSVNF